MATLTKEQAISNLEKLKSGVNKHWGKIADASVLLQLVNTPEQFEREIDDASRLSDKWFSEGFDSSFYYQIQDSVLLLLGIDDWFSDMDNDERVALSSPFDWWNQVKDIDDYYDYADDKQKYVNKLADDDLIKDFERNVNNMKRTSDVIDSIIAQSSE